jgi:hypothetical protein
MAGAALILCLSFMVTPHIATATNAKTPELNIVPTTICSCGSQSQAQVIGGNPFRGHGPPMPSAVYDEQIGLTFTQSFTSLEYNVIVVEQTDQTLGDGPAYLLNGVSNTNYWYQVGVSWNWNPGTNPGTGFDMNYEVFDNAGNSIFPTDGDGGIAAFSGPVNDGDVVTLNLYFSNSSQTVVMLADDTNTGASASEVFSNMGATYFTGLPDAVANSNGYFTGLMTEWYHGVPYYANEAEVIFSNPSYALSSAWMWMDEFDANNFQGIFSANTSAPVSYTDPSKLQEFSFNGTTEYSDAYEFVTGALTNSTQSNISTVPLTLSYVVQGTSAGYSPPTLSYVSNGTSRVTPLTGTPTIYSADLGTEWNVSSLLSGSTSTERFQTDQPTSGQANSSLTVQFVYYQQYYVTFGFSVMGGGSGFSPPTVTFTSFGNGTSTPTGVGVWADAGSRYVYQDALSGASAAERWFAENNGSITSPQSISAAYYHQYLVDFALSFQNTQVFPGVTLSSTSGGQPYTATLVLGSNSEWLDSGATYSVPQSFSIASGQRLITNGSYTGTISANLVVQLVYQHQFYIEVTQNVSGGGTASPASGWYDSGSTLTVAAAAAQGWQFEGWTGVGADSVTNTSASFVLTVGPGAPANETAAFYPGVTLDANGPDSVFYHDGSISGTISAGTQSVVYVPPSSNLSLTASNTAFLATFSGWSGAISSSHAQTTFAVDGPATIASNSQYDYEIVAIAAIIILAAVGAIVVLARRKGPSPAALA